MESLVATFGKNQDRDKQLQVTHQVMYCPVRASVATSSGGDAVVAVCFSICLCLPVPVTPISTDSTHCIGTPTDKNITKFRTLVLCSCIPISFSIDLSLSVPQLLEWTATTGSLPLRGCRGNNEIIGSSIEICDSPFVKAAVAVYTITECLSSCSRPLKSKMWMNLMSTVSREPFQDYDYHILCDVSTILQTPQCKFTLVCAHCLCRMV